MKKLILILSGIIILIILSGCSSSDLTGYKKPTLQSVDFKSKEFYVSDDIPYVHFNKEENQLYNETIRFTRFLKDDCIELSVIYLNKVVSYQYKIHKGSELQIPESKNKIIINDFSYDENRITVTMKNGE